MSDMRRVESVIDSGIEGSADVPKAVTIVQLRHRPSGQGSSGTSPAAPTSSSRAAKAEGITFDQSSSVVRFHADDLGRCVPLFLEQWERLSKVIIVAGDGEHLHILSGSIVANHN